MCVSLCAIRKYPHIIILRWFVKRYLLTFSFQLLSWCRHNLSHNAWNRFHQQLLGKTDMNSTQSNKTARFRFKLKVVLQIVCVVHVLLAPKLIFYMSTSELLFTNFKDAAFSSRVALQWCIALSGKYVLWELWCGLSDNSITDNYASITLYQSIKSTHPDDWVLQQ